MMQPKGGPMLYSVFIAICLAATPHPACQKDNSTMWVQAPEDAPGLAACQRLGMLYIAESRLVGPGVYPKVFCRADSIPTPEGVGRG